MWGILIAVAVVVLLIAWVSGLYNRLVDPAQPLQERVHPDRRAAQAAATT